MEEKEKYWIQRISTSKIGETLTVCDAVIWKSNPGTLKINVDRAQSGKFTKCDGMSIRVKNGKVDVFYQIKGVWRNGNARFDTTLPNIGGSKAYNSLILTINHFLAKNAMPKLPTNKIRAAIREKIEWNKKCCNDELKLTKSRDRYSWQDRVVSLASRNSNSALTEIKTALREYIYPATKTVHENIDCVAGMPTLLRKKEFNLDEWAKFAVGRKTKKIVKLMRESIDNRYFYRFVGALREMRGLFTLDHLYLFNDSPLTAELTRRGARGFMKQLGEARRLSILNSLRLNKGIRGGWEFKDSIDQWTNLGKIAIPAEYKNIKEIHDWLSAEYRKSKTVSRPIPYSEKFEAIDGAEIEDLRLELPKETETLYTYGKKLGQCVASYGDMAVRKVCQIVAVYRGEELLYNLEIRQKVIHQFRGKYNKNPDANDRERVVEFLEKSGVVTMNNYYEPA